MIDLVTSTTGTSSWQMASVYVKAGMVLSFTASDSHSKAYFTPFI